MERALRQRKIRSIDTSVMKHRCLKSGSSLMLLLWAFTLGSAGLYAQHSLPDEILPYRIHESINWDGMPDEKVWQEAQHIRNFTQRDLDFGQPVTERTEVAVLYDRNTLYFGIWCYQKDPSKIVSKNMVQDFNYRSDDNFQIIIGPFDDHRTGYLFVINPSGARADIQVYSGEDGNEDWDGVWDVRTRVNEQGWFAELYIPFSTLQFKKDSILNWAINFERDIVSENEQALWQGWSRDYSIYSIANAGRLKGIRDVAYAKKFEAKPYLLAGLRYFEGEEPAHPLKVGGDLNISLSPTLKLNLTTYTDFAQVEADRIPVNLSRFSVFYPEKRQFFLEGSDNFSYYLGDRNSAFYSREIGVENGRQIPLLAGARLFGKVGRSNIGFLNIEEGAADSISSTNNTVLRYKYDLAEQSYVGGIFTNKINNKVSNQVLGLDAAYQTSKFLGNKNLAVGAKWTMSAEDFAFNSDAFTYRIYADYPNDLIDNFMAIGSMRENFNPALGFVRRTNYDSYTWFFRWTPRVLTQYGVKRLLLKPWGFILYRTHTTGELESFFNETRPLGAVFKSGERFELNFIQQYDRLDEPFALTDAVFVPVGKYMMYQYEIQLETYDGRRVRAALLYNWGGFYGGRKQTFEGELGVNVNKHFNINASYTYNFVSLPAGDVATNEVALYLNYAFTPKLNVSLFSQYNDLEEIMIYNLRLHWIPKVGSDLYFVYNMGYEEPIHQIELLRPQSTDAAVKLVYRFVF